jgi:hypothetical protein
MGRGFARPGEIGQWITTLFMEGFWRNLKYEDVYQKDYKSKEEVKAGLRRYFCVL